MCNIDQPLIGKGMKPSSYATADVGYVRLHGRNYKQWFSESASVAERYDYLYSRGELDPWADRVKSIAGTCTLSRTTTTSESHSKRS